MAQCPRCHNHELRVRVDTAVYPPLNHVTMQPAFERASLEELGQQARHNAVKAAATRFYCSNCRSEIQGHDLVPASRPAQELMQGSPGAGRPPGADGR